MMLHRWVFQRLDNELQRAHGLAVTEFDVLITLYNAPDKRLRMSALAERVLLSPAGATHLVTRLERDRMVRREVDPTDRRKWFAVLTDEGDATLRSARRTHNDVLRQTLLALTTPSERRTLGRILRRLAERQPHPLAPINPDP
jgi:DNA-binding MarR family transcriptional regulator